MVLAPSFELAQGDFIDVLAFRDLLAKALFVNREKGSSLVLDPGMITGLAVPVEIAPTIRTPCLWVLGVVCKL